MPPAPTPARTSSQIHKALHDTVLPYAMTAFPELDLRCCTTPSDKNLFIVKYAGSGGRPALSMHKDQVPLTVNISLSAQVFLRANHGALAALRLGLTFPSRGGKVSTDK